ILSELFNKYLSPSVRFCKEMEEPVVNYTYEPLVAAQAEPNERAAFIRRTYGHLAGAILAFAILEMLAFLLVFPTQEECFRVGIILFGSSSSMLLLLGGFIGFGWLAQIWAQNSTSRALQYVGLGLYVVIQAVIFLPLLIMAVYYTGDPTILPTAAILT